MFDRLEKKKTRKRAKQSNVFLSEEEKCLNNLSDYVAEDCQNYIIKWGVKPMRIILSDKAYLRLRYYDLIRCENGEEYYFEFLVIHANEQDYWNGRLSETKLFYLE